MKRYHEKVYFPVNTSDNLKAFNDKLNAMTWTYSLHCLDNIKYRFIDLKEVMTYIKNLKLDYKNIFEYYTEDNDDIIKACYRIKYGIDIDIILVISHNKNIVTIYINTSSDKHVTLNKSLYIQG